MDAIRGKISVGNAWTGVKPLISRSELIDFCNSTLDASRFRDVSVNGVQVEGAATIDRVATAVSVSERIIQSAIDWRATMLLVHHGLFWGERAGPVVGPLRNRLRLLLQSDLNLACYHLPLDAHPEIGNNVLLARALELEIIEPFAEVAGQPIGVIAATDPLELAALATRVAGVTERTPTVLHGGPDEILRIGILSGSGYSALEEAASRGCQALVTGDVREPTMALAKELGVSVIAGGHEATERLGIQALGALLARDFDVETRFFGDPNPI